MSACADFRDRLLTGSPLLGSYLKTPSAIVAEVLGFSALDAICLDAEHAAFDRLSLDACVSALRAADMPSLVRVEADRPEQIMQALDYGATGVIVPHLTSAEQAEAVFRAAHFGERGRGYAGSTRAAGYGTKALAQHLGDSARETTVIGQIEDREGLAALDEIAAAPGLDCLFVGRVDLAVALGLDSVKDEKVMRAVARVCESGRAAGKAVGMFVPDPEELPHWRKLGVSFFLLGSDHAFILSGAAKLRQRLPRKRAR